LFLECGKLDQVRWSWSSLQT